jgi:hypothetical protein
MRKSSAETTINTKELNKMLPSYLLKEFEEDAKINNLSEESKFKAVFNGKVSKIIFLDLILKYIF